MKKKVLIVVICLFLAWCVRGAYVQNTVHHFDGTETYGFHEPVQFDNYQVEVVSFETERMETFCDKHDLDDSFNYGEDFYVGLVGVKVKNTTDDLPGEVPLYQMVIETKTATNGMDLFLFQALHNNDTSTFSPYIMPGEEAYVEIPFTECSEYYGVEGNLFEQLPFAVTMSIYPVKKMVYLNDLW